MEEDIKILEKYIKDFHKRNKYCIAFREDLLKTAIEHLLQAHKENEAVIEKMVEHIASSAIVDDMVCMYKDCDREECDNNIARECTEQYFRKKVQDDLQS